jgi:hypothetical protein
LHSTEIQQNCTEGGETKKLQLRSAGINEASHLIRERILMVKRHEISAGMSSNTTHQHPSFRFCIEYPIHDYPLITGFGNLRKCRLPAQMSGKSTLLPFIAWAAILAHLHLKIL